MNESKFKILELVVHILDPDKKPMMILGVIERPQHWSYLCTSYDNNEQEYLEQELKKY
jgi:hypothetical protein